MPSSIFTVIISTLLLTLPFIQSVCFFPSHGGKVRWQVFCDLTVNDLTRTTGGNFLNCVDNCRGNSECTHFTFNYFTLTCYLKSGNRNTASTLNLIPSNMGHCGYLLNRTQPSAVSGLADCPATQILFIRLFDDI